MTGVATNTTDDVGSEVTLLRAIVLSVSNLSTVLACLVLVISKGTVESSKFTKLVAFQLVLALWNRCSLDKLTHLEKISRLELGTYSLNDIVNELFGFVDLLLGIGHDQAMEILFLVASMSGIGAAFSFFDGSFSTNCDLGLRFCFHFLQGVTTGTDK